MYLRHLSTLSARYPHSTRRGGDGSEITAIVGAATEYECLRRGEWIFDGIDISISDLDSIQSSKLHT